MEGIREYLISVVAICMVSVLAAQLVKKRTQQKIARFVSGILVLLVVTTPLLSLDIEDFSDLIEELSLDYDLDTQELAKSTSEQLAKHIKGTTETYVEAKAAELGATVQAEVQLTNENYPAPCGITIIGTASTEQVKELSDYLTNALGITPEQQEWKLYGTSE